MSEIVATLTVVLPLIVSATAIVCTRPCSNSAATAPRVLTLVTVDLLASAALPGVFMLGGLVCTLTVIGVAITVGGAFVSLTRHRRRATANAVRFHQETTIPHT